MGYIKGYWHGFVDQQSGIRYYSVGLGSKPLIDDIENMVNVGLRTGTDTFIVVVEKKYSTSRTVFSISALLKI